MTAFANPLRGEVMLDLGKEKILLRPSFEALARIEEEVGSLFTLIERASSGQVSLQDMVCVLHACALAGGASCTRAEMGERIATHGLSKASQAFVQVLGHALKGPE